MPPALEWGRRRAEWDNPSLPQLCLMPPRTGSVLLATRAQWLTFNCHSPGPPAPFPQHCSPASLSQAYTHHKGCPGAEPALAPVSPHSRRVARRSRKLGTETITVHRRRGGSGQGGEEAPERVGLLEENQRWQGRGPVRHFRFRRSSTTPATCV